MAGRLIAIETGIWILSSYGFSERGVFPTVYSSMKTKPCPCFSTVSVHPFSIWLRISSVQSDSTRTDPRQMGREAPCIERSPLWFSFEARESEVKETCPDFQTSL